MTRRRLLIIIMVLLSFVFNNCDSSYSCYIANESSQSVTAKIYPPFDSFKDHLPSNYSEYFNNYIVEENIDFTMIEIPTNTKVIIFSNLGVVPHLNSFHIKKIEIYSGDAIVVLDSKEKIISAFEKNPKKRLHKLIIK